LNKPRPEKNSRKERHYPQQYQKYKRMSVYKQNQTMMMMMNKKILPFAHISFNWRKEDNQ
jgi:hypothetical protein